MRAIFSVFQLLFGLDSAGTAERHAVWWFRMQVVACVDVSVWRHAWLCVDHFGLQCSARFVSKTLLLHSQAFWTASAGRYQLCWVSSSRACIWHMQQWRAVVLADATFEFTSITRSHSLSSASSLTAEQPRCRWLSLAQALASTSRRRWCASAARHAGRAASRAPRRTASGMSIPTTARRPPARREHICSLTVTTTALDAPTTSCEQRTPPRPTALPASCTVALFISRCTCSGSLNTDAYAAP